MSYAIKDIEALVITALNAAPLNVYCKNIVAYGGQLEVVDAKFADMDFPAVFVTYNGDTLAETTPLLRYVEDMTITVIVAARTRRTDISARNSVVGAFQMLEDVKTILHLNNLGKNDVVGLVLKRRFPIRNTREVAIFGMEFSFKFVA